jgi:hypothetical protein
MPEILHYNVRLRIAPLRIHNLCSMKTVFPNVTKFPEFQDSLRLKENLG